MKTQDKSFQLFHFTVRTLGRKIQKRQLQQPRTTSKQRQVVITMDGETSHKNNNLRARREGKNFRSFNHNLRFLVRKEQKDVPIGPTSAPDNIRKTSKRRHNAISRQCGILVAQV